MSAPKLSDEKVVPIGSDLLNPLEAQCLEKLSPVRFGVYSNTDRVVGALRSAKEAGRPVTPAQRLALYKICWRYREQIADNKFTARVLIAQALLEEMMDVAELIAGRVYARAWRANSPPPQRSLGLP